MSLHSRVVTVTTSPTLLTLQQSDGRVGSTLAVAVHADGVTVFLGGSDVTAASGYPCAPGTEHFIDLDAGAMTTAVEDAYAVVAAATQAVNVLQAGV
jgi:hypothetical protein